MRLLAREMTFPFEQPSCYSEWRPKDSCEQGLDMITSIRLSRALTFGLATRLYASRNSRTSTITQRSTTTTRIPALIASRSATGKLRAFVRRTLEVVGGF